MNTRSLLFTVIVIIGVVMVALIFFAVAAVLYLTPVRSQTTQVIQPEPAGTADPQRLMIPRWFLRELVLDGRAVELPADQQVITLQFVEDGSANGGGGCNSFFTTYQAGPGDQLRFGEIGATKMACDLLALETDYFQALARVERFDTSDFRLTLSSADGSTRLVYEMPPK